MKTFVQFLKEGNASDFSYAPDQMGEDICMPGNSMFDAGRLMSEDPDPAKNPQTDMVDAPNLEEPGDKDIDAGGSLDEHLGQVDGKWALLSKKTGKALRYYKGSGKPSKEWVAHAERSVQYWKHHG